MNQASAYKSRCSKLYSPAIVAGLIIGIAASQTVLAAATLVRALGDAGAGRTISEAVVTAAFAIGRIEGSLLICPLVAKLTSRRR
jgi:hypothetical protein